MDIWRHSVENHTTHRRLGAARIAIPLLVLAVLLAACGGGATDDGGSAPTETETTTEAAGETQSLKIGALFSLTGASASFDEPAARGLEMAVEEVNSNGGVTIDGTTYEIDLHLEDVQSSAEVAVAAARELHTNEEINIMFGNVTSSVGSAVAQYMKEARILYFAAFTTLDAELGTEGAELLFKTTPPQAVSNAEYIPAAIEALGLQQGMAAMFPNEDVSRQIIDDASSHFEEAGVPLVSNELFQTGTTDFAPLLGSVRDLEIDGLYVGYSQADIENLVRQAVTVSGVPLNFVLYGSAAEPGLNHRDQIDGYTWQSLTREVVHSDDPDLSEWVENFRQFTGKDELITQDSWALAYDDPFFAALAAMQSAGTVSDVEALADVLHDACYDGVRLICWDGEGRANADFDMGILKDGEVSVQNIALTPPEDSEVLTLER